MTAPELYGLYAITPDCANGERLLADVEAALLGGCRIVQYRDKLSNMAERAARARALHPVQHHDLDKAADVQRGRGGVEADVARHNARRRRRIQLGRVGDLMDVAARLEGLQEVGLEILVAHGGSVSRDAGGRHGSLRAGVGGAWVRWPLVRSRGGNTGRW